MFICNRCVEECSQAIDDVPTRIPGAARTCEFCSKAEDQVAVTIAVGDVIICDECVHHYRSAI
jgi:hypothetical protein